MADKKPQDKEQLVEQAKKVSVDLGMGNHPSEIKKAMDVANGDRRPTTSLPSEEDREFEEQLDDNNTDDNVVSTTEGNKVEPVDKQVKFHLEHGTPAVIIQGITGLTERELSAKAKKLGYKLNDSTQGKTQAPPATGIGVND